MHFFAFFRWNCILKMNVELNLFRITVLKVRKSRKQFMVSPILPKNERKNEKIRPNSTMIPHVEFFVRFLGEMKTLLRFTDL